MRRIRTTRIMVLLVIILTVSAFASMTQSTNAQMEDNVSTEVFESSENTDIPYDSQPTTGEAVPEATEAYETESAAAIESESSENINIPYDSQPTTGEAVQAAITAYETEYAAILDSEGGLAALEVPKPHWQYEVAAELMPDDYNCQLVDWDEDFGAYYYTFFQNPVARAFGMDRYKLEPPNPNGSNITDTFNIISGSVDTQYPNVAIITEDLLNQYGAMWAKDKLDLTLPFNTEIFLHLGHQDGKIGAVADGMTFTLHNDPAGISAIGGLGEGLGVYKGRKSTDGEYTEPNGTYLRNSLVIEFDTYPNQITGDAFVDDPEYPHCAVVIPRADVIYQGDHKNSFQFDPTQDWVKFLVEWEPDGLGGGMLTYSFGDTTKRGKIASITSLFGGTEVYWGFTGTTGGYSALQAAAITKLPVYEFSVDFYKLGYADEPLQGAAFELYNCTNIDSDHIHGVDCSWNAGSIYKTAQQSDVDGKVTIEHVAAGSYIMVESTTPAKYKTPSAASYILLNVADDGTFTMTGHGDFAGSDMLLEPGVSFQTGYYEIRNQLSAVDLRVKKVISNYGNYGSAAQADLAQRPFMISLSGGANGGIMLQHNETSGDMSILVNSVSDTIYVSEIVPMEFSTSYEVSAAIIHADGTTETQTGREITVKPGDDVTITVTNKFIHKPFFKAWNYFKNTFT